MGQTTTTGDAERLSMARLQIIARLDDSAAFMQQKGDDAHWQAYRHALGQAMGSVICEFVEPLFQRFPELRPEQIGDSCRVDPSIHPAHFSGA